MYLLTFSNILLYIKHQALEVLALGVIDVDGVVGWLVKLMEYANLSLGLSSSGEYGIAEVLLGNYLRTGEREQDTPWLYLLQRLHIQASIALERITQGSTMLGESWRVEHYDVIVACSLVQILEGILADGNMTLIAREVEVYILSGELDGTLRTVNGMDLLCPTPHGIEGEAASVAEHVKHSLALGVALEERAVLTLVNEEARLLASQVVNTEFQTILYGYGVVRMSVKEHIFLYDVGLKGQSGLALVIHILYTVAHDLDQFTRYGLSLHVHAYRVCLHNGSIAVAVDYQAWEIVALAMHKTVGVVIRVVGNAYVLAHLECYGESFVPKSAIDSLISESEYSNRYGTYLEVTSAYKLAT